MPRSQLQPQHAWLIGIPLNLLLAIPGYLPVLFLWLAGEVLAGQLGWMPVDPTLIHVGVGLIYGMAIGIPIIFGLVVMGLNNIFLSRTPGVSRAHYWPAVVLLITIPNLFLVTSQ